MIFFARNGFQSDLQKLPKINSVPSRSWNENCCDLILISVMKRKTDGGGRKTWNLLRDFPIRRKQKWEISVHVCECVCECVCERVCECVCVDVCVHKDERDRVFERVGVCVFLCMWVYVCMYASIWTSFYFLCLPAHVCERAWQYVCVWERDREGDEREREGDFMMWQETSKTEGMRLKDFDWDQATAVPSCFEQMISKLKVEKLQ